MEGQIFVCGWKKEAKLYRVWVKKRPSLAAQGRTFNQADKRLWSAIIVATGDGESIREYQPAAPESEPEILPVVTLTSNDAPWIETLSQRTRRRRDAKLLDTNAKIARQFELRVNEHFTFLGELGLKGPKFSSKYDRLTGMSWTARFASEQRTLDIGLSKAHKEYASSTDFEVDTRPAADRWEAFLSTMYLGLKHKQLLDKLTEFDRRHTLDEIMEVEFPIYAQLFRGELHPILIGAMWHDDYEFYRDG